jgi:hypothetical protein
MLLALGCVPVRAETFPAVYADTWCSEVRRCDARTFEDRFGDGTTCRESTDAWVREQLDLPDGDCPFDPDEADTCLDDLRDASCEALEANDFSAACDAVLSACLVDTVGAG